MLSDTETTVMVPHPDNLLTSGTTHPMATWRAGLVSLVFAVLLGTIIPVVDFKYNNTYLGSQHFAPAAIGVLLLLVIGVNPLLRLVKREWCLSQDEMLIVYLSCLFSALVAGIGGNNYWPSQISGAFYYATPQNKWLDVLHSLPSWLTPALDIHATYHPEIITPFYTGLTKGNSIPWAAWIVPMVAWGSLPVATMILTGCLSVILRAQWSESEALAFPLLRLPMEMTETRASPLGLPGPFFRNPAMWIGFGIAALIQLANGLHLYFPDVPPIATSIDATPYISEAPWNQIGDISLEFFPVAIGLSYLISAEVSFSLWFFFWSFKLQYLSAYFMGFQPNNMPTVMPMAKVFTGYQEVGAYLAIMALILWTGREHYLHVARRAFGMRAAGSGERDEALPYPMAFWGMVLSFGYLIGWSFFAGVHPLVALTYWGSYIVISVVLARVLADSGLLFVSKLHTPLGMWSDFFGSGTGTMLGGVHAGPTAFLGGTGDMRSCIMPSWVTALKLVSDRKLPSRPIFFYCAGAMILSVIVSSQMHVRLAYEYGALSWANVFTPRSAPQAVGRAAMHFSQSQGVQGPAVLAWTTVGIAVVFVLSALRARFPWFILHPTGYVMAQSWAMHRLWLSVLIGWLAKTAITRFGGHEASRKATPLFLGLALGDVTMMLLWIVIDIWCGHSGHNLIP